MIALLVLSVIFNIALTAGLVISTYRNLQLIEKLDELGEQVDSSLDILNHCYAQITHATEIPVLSDEPVIRGVLEDIQAARNAVLVVANKLVSFDSTSDEDDNEPA